MSFQSTINKNCVQTAVYWGNPVNDGYGGKTFDTAVEIDCRWEEGHKQQNHLIKSVKGLEIIMKARVFVTQDVEEEGYLFLGKLTDLDSDHTEPVKIDGTFKILRFEKIPAMKKTDIFIRAAYI